MNVKCCFTDHSLFGFADTSSILTNKLLKFTLSDIDHVICVSHTSKENTCLRAALNPLHVSVIPNAVVASQFTPDPSASDPNAITIVVMSRLVYRKGMDLLAAVIPKACAAFPHVRFVIAGDGPKRIDLEQMREKHLLHDRVELLGAVKHSEVRNVLVRGNIFLNTSLTEAFCIGIVEAACCGLLVVSTKVGGVPEVLPKHMILFGKPEEDDLVQTVGRAVSIVESKDVDPFEFHREVREMYSWNDVAERTEKVYEEMRQTDALPLIDRLRLYYGCGLWAGKLFCMVVAVDYLLLRLLDWFFPSADIDTCPTFDQERYKQVEEASNATRK
jgi:phosphatidylinositol glycan class A protein